MPDIAVLDGDTIVAPATPAGRGGIGIVRISGPAVPAMTTAIVGALPPPRRARFVRFLDGSGEAIDAGLVLYFPAPGSFTGEDVLELQGHGGPVVTEMLVARALELGARLARPGEFTERAFLNDKIDLAQAEAVADLIDAGSAQAARAAMRSLQGEFSVEVHDLAEAVTALRVYVEAAIDFPEEDVEFLASPEVVRRVDDIEARFARIDYAAGQGRLLRDGLSVVIAGKPNAGKSSLLNALAGYEAAIVTDVPGTTRDVLRERIHVDGLPVHVIDTAGLRETADVIEGEGVRRARGEMERADVVLYVIDSTTPPAGDALERVLETLQQLKPRRLLTVFGCGGDRDRSKRPVMGEVAARCSDLAVVTSDNPRTEDPARILADVCAGVAKIHPRAWSAVEAAAGTGRGYLVIPDRREAIRFAVAQLQAGDLLLVAGKGHEDYQILGTRRIHFDDREELRAALAARSEA